MNSDAQVLQPAASFLAGLESGELAIKDLQNRICRSDDGVIVASLVPGHDLQAELAKLPLDPEHAAHAIAESGALRPLAPLLDRMRLASTVGALGSVANIGSSCVNFAAVLPRLSRIDGKLDECLENVIVLKSAVQKLHSNMHALSMARLKPADDALERSLMADSTPSRIELAQRSHDQFSESKNLYLELWKHAHPWKQPSVGIPTAIEIMNRYVTCAIGEIQAEFVCGDMGRFKHAVRTAAAEYARVFRLDAADALRARSDRVCSEHDMLARFDGRLPAMSAQLRLASGVVQYTNKRLAAFEEDASLPELLDLEPHQVARVTRTAYGCSVYALVASTASLGHDRCAQ